MSSVPIIQVCVSALVALSVVLLGHYFTVRRDRQNRLREQRVEYLISVYRAFCSANNHPRLWEVADKVEQAVADVQLFGTPEQVRIVQQFADELGGAKQEASLDDILLSFRDSLRAELGSDALDRRHVWLKIEAPTNSRK